MPRNPPRPQPGQARHLLDELHHDLINGHVDIATAVRRMRQISGLTQPEFARHRGISLQTLRQIETAKGNPTVETLDRIASIFGFRTGFVPRDPGHPPKS
ncbi:MAG: XRE family transcriptional regulator [Wenzhouxiangella sp.]|nr:MAG: XRE family transcriptional regulator [Wenzhouxiangella sp.]